MGMFGFDERYAVFDVTPVDNQFILEYLPAAKGDYVKVYLYGLTQCCHPQADMDMTSLSRELGMTEEEVQSAYRYWEQRIWRLYNTIKGRPNYLWGFVKDELNVSEADMLKYFGPQPELPEDFVP